MPARMAQNHQEGSISSRRCARNIHGLAIGPIGLMIFSHEGIPSSGAASRGGLHKESRRPQQYVSVTTVILYDRPRKSLTTSRESRPPFRALPAFPVAATLHERHRRGYPSRSGLHAANENFSLDGKRH
jgi:hypothetical protein